MLKLKYSLLTLAVFMMAGLVLSGNAHASPICDTLEECQSLQAYLQEELVKRESEAIREYLRSQLTQVDARIQELLTCQPGNPEKRTTNTGAVFTRDRSHAALGEAWRDPDGLIWGDIVKDEDESVRYMVQSSRYMKEAGSPLPNGTLGAKEYCKSIGARLPSEKEFTKLREYLGWDSSQGYSHHDDEILPNLSKNDDEIFPNFSKNWFWSSSVDPDNAYVVYYFNGSSGSIYSYSRSGDFAVRCVVDH